MTKMVQLSMDRPSLTLKLLKKLEEQRNKLEFPGLIDFGSYNLHIVHDAFNSSAETSGWNLKKIVKAVLPAFN